MNKVILAPGIVVYKNINLNILDTIKSLSKDEWGNEYVKDINGEVKIDKEARDTLSVEIPYSLSTKDPEHIANISKNISAAIDLPIEDYCMDHQISLKSRQPYKILMYGINGHFGTHSDDGGGTFRRTSIVYYLNDDYSGGEIEFLKFNVVYKPEKGDLIVFPSAYIYQHRVLPVKSGTRYSIASWLR